MPTGRRLRPLKVDASLTRHSYDRLQQPTWRTRTGSQGTPASPATGTMGTRQAVHPGVAAAPRLTPYPPAVDGTPIPARLAAPPSLPPDFEAPPISGGPQPACGALDLAERASNEWPDPEADVVQLFRVHATIGAVLGGVALYWLSQIGSVGVLLRDNLDPPTPGSLQAWLLPHFHAVFNIHFRAVFHAMLAGIRWLDAIADWIGSLVTMVAIPIAVWLRIGCAAALAGRTRHEWPLRVASWTVGLYAAALFCPIALALLCFRLPAIQ